jgi:hypothetical protein
MEVLGYMAILLVGLLLGSIGSGGSMLSLPVLVYLFAIDIETASAYSLFLVGTTSLTGAVLKYREQLVSVQVGFMFGLPSVISTFVSRRWILDGIPQRIGGPTSVVVWKEDLLIGLFAMLMIASGVAILRRGSLRHAPYGARRLGPLVLCGFVVGGVAGLAGAGGGFLILPALLFFARLPFPTAVGTTLTIIACNCLLGFCGDLFIHSIDWSFLLSITGFAIGGLLAGLTSDKFASRLPTQKAFAWLTLTLGILMLIHQFV